MKRFLILLLIALPLITGFVSSIDVYIETKRVEFPDQQPVIVNNRILIPVRFVAEELGAEVFWNNEKREVLILFEDREISLIVGENTARVDGDLVKLNTPVEIHGGRTMVPLRFITNALEKSIRWDDLTRVVHISNKR